MTVEVGTPAPDFTLPDQHRQPTTLSSFRGERPVVLVFFPLAFTGVCTGELCAIRDRLPVLDGSGAQVIGISCDSGPSLRVFADQEGIEYPLLSDHWPHGEVARRYGVFDERLGLALRGSFVIDREGLVRWATLNQIPDARDVADYERALAGL